MVLCKTMTLQFVAAMTDDFSAIDIKELQEKLAHNGVVLHEKDILK